MNDDALTSGTGKRLEQWRVVIADAGLSEASHREIATYLHTTQGVTYWWAQTITVEYEKLIGRRIHGQTQDGLFQLGVNRTIGVRSDVLWEFVDSSSGETAILGQHVPVETGFVDLHARLASGLSVTTTTYVPRSHFRMQWRERDWSSHSILQVRVTPKDGERSVLTFHHEKLPSLADREGYRRRWSDTAERIDSEVTDGA
jgi:hypothetical protein